MKRKKIALIGSGNIGGAAVCLAGLKELGDVVLVSAAAGYAWDKALDLTQVAPASGGDIYYEGSSGYFVIAGANVVIVSADARRNPVVKSRDDFLEPNLAIAQKTGAGLAEYASHAFVICITNLLDAMARVLQKFLGLPAGKIVGMAEAYLKDKKRVLPVSACLSGQYGGDGFYRGVSAIIGGQAAKRIVELDLTPQESEIFKASAEAVKALCAVCAAAWVIAGFRSRCHMAAFMS